MSAPAASSASFETALQSLQLAVRALESGELSLEDSLRKFEEGVTLARACQEQLAAASARIEIVSKAAGGEPELKPFGK